MTKAPGIACRIQVLLPVPRGPNKKNAPCGRVSDRVNSTNHFYRQVGADIYSKDVIASRRLARFGRHMRIQHGSC